MKIFWHHHHYCKCGNEITCVGRDCVESELEVCDKCMVQKLKTEQEEQREKEVEPKKYEPYVIPERFGRWIPFEPNRTVVCMYAVTPYPLPKYWEYTITTSSTGDKEVGYIIRGS